MSSAIEITTSREDTVSGGVQNEQISSGGEFSVSWKEHKEIVLSSADEVKPHISSLKSQPSSLIRIADKNDVNLVKLFAYVVCGEYLSGAWKDIEFEDFRIHRIS